ncbi:MAG: nickel pincer cofactor biosynthesis protein LarC [Candidatus Brocadiales bacterium]|nr:nickel pincer cofactor biosynthesis protein LarC [Candidatus Brocadiales bacterium]
MWFLCYSFKAFSFNTKGVAGPCLALPWSFPQRDIKRVKVAYFDCFSGASGDMILGSLVDAGLDSAVLARELRKLSLPPHSVSFKKVLRAGIAGTKFDVLPGQDSKETVRYLSFKELCRPVEQSGLPENVLKDSLKILKRLGECEAKVHNTTLEDVHFHELGALDTVLDVVGAVVAFDKLGVEEIFFSPLPAGSGFVDCEHGRLPVPAPITLELLRGQKVVSGPANRGCELTTPTGAAILTTLGKCAESCPDIALDAIGYGAGSRDFSESPNLLRVLLGEKSAVAGGDEVWVIETNVDDMTGELCGYVTGKILEAGAVDVYTTAVQMKKNRPGVLFTAIVPEGAKEAVEKVFFRETTTFGVRSYKTSRRILGRSFIEVETRYGPVKVKVGRLNGQIKNMSPEYEDCRRIAESKAVPLKTVYEAAMEATKNL